MNLEPEKEMLVRASEVLVGDGEGHCFARVWPAWQDHGHHLPKEKHRPGSGENSISTSCF